MSDELILPPYIEERQGLYFNTKSNRWVGLYKIKAVCDEYSENMDKGGSEVNDNGIIHNFKNGNIRKGEKKHEFQNRFGKNRYIDKNSLEERSFSAAADILLSGTCSEEKKPTSKKEKKLRNYTKPENHNRALVNKRGRVDSDVKDNSRQIIQKTLEGIFVQKFNSIKQASKQFGGKKSDEDKIKAAMRAGRTHRTHGYLWEYFEESIKMKKEMPSLDDPKWLKHVMDIDERIAKENAKYDDTCEVNLDKAPFLASVINNSLKNNLDETKNKIIYKKRKPRRENKPTEIKWDFEELEIMAVEYTKASEISSELLKSEELVDISNSSIVKYDEKVSDENNYIDCVKLLWDMENHDGLNVIISEICIKEWGVDWIYIRENIRNELVPKYSDIWCEEIMSMICHALWIKIPTDNRIEWLSIFLNRKPAHIRGLLGIYYREMHTTSGLWYDHKNNDTSWWEFAGNFDYPLADYFLPYYKFDYTYKYR
jgi:hypothetical protein